MESQKQEKMKSITKIIIAFASIFSFILSYSSLVSSLQQKLHLLSIYINLVDKKYIFLLCNGIVGFIMGNFKTLLHGNAINIVEETEELRINYMRKSEMKNVVTLIEEQHVSKEEEEALALLGEQCVSNKEERVDLLREEEEVTMVVEDDNGGKDLTVFRSDDQNDGDNDDDINDLNKKCEEFIRKMKAGIRLESRELFTS